MKQKTTQSKSKEKKARGLKANVSILMNPRVTEKTAKASAGNVYVFNVAVSATKNEIAKAFEVMYKHVPLKVHTLTRKPKSHFKRTAGGSQLGFGKKTKNAYIYLAKGVTIDVM